MKELLQTLIKLQAIDTELMEIEARKGNLPQRLAELEQQMRELTESVAAMRKKIEENEKEQAHLRGETADNEVKLEKYQDQLYLVTTNREYDALTNQIEIIKNRVKEAKQRLEELATERNNLQEELRLAEAKQKELDAETNKKREELAQKTTETNARQAELERQKEELIRNLRPRYLRKYERILKARKNAVVPVQRGACGGCHKQLSPQKLFEIRQMDRLVECENCGRILVYLEDE